MEEKNLMNIESKVEFNNDYLGTGLNYPKSVFPEPLKAQINAFAQYDKITETMVSHLALAGIGAAISNKFYVDVNYDGWKEKSNLFSIALANPGSNKSGVISIILKPFLEKQIAVDKAYEERVLTIEKYNKLIKDMNKLHEKIDDYRDSEKLTSFIAWMKKERLYHLYNEEKDEIIRFDEAPKPKHYEIYLSSGTTEKRDQILATNNGRPLVIIRDEFKGLFKSFNQYKSGKGDDLESFLTLFDYTPQYKSNVSGRFKHSDRAVSAIGTSQFKVFSDMFEGGKNQDNGLIHRFLVVDSTGSELRNPFKLRDGGNKTNELEEYRKLVEIMIGDFDNYEHTLMRLEMDDEAYAYGHNWREKINDLYLKSELLQNNVSFEDFSSFAGKFDRYLVRFAIIMRVFRFYYSNDPFERNNWENPDKPIILDDMIKSEKLTMYYLNNAINFLNNIHPFGSSKIKNKNESMVLERMVTNTPKKELLATINKVYGYRSSNGTNTTARRKLNEFLDRKIINKKITPQGESVYNSAI